ncbi:serine protease 40-like isoform X3 [Peromyscus maniculatus bairdii]|uniref:serine protease 40-like isoform X3 n=1 Tax=Peromyscus maniculatus bairdii TaxID=230844 RepID=UPI003FD23633
MSPKRQFAGVSGCQHVLSDLSGTQGQAVQMRCRAPGPSNRAWVPRGWDCLHSMWQDQFPREDLWRSDGKTWAVAMAGQSALTWQSYLWSSPHRQKLGSRRCPLLPKGSDIVLMQLESPVEFSSHILPACVPDKNTTIPSHKACWASGWGHLREDVRQPLPDDLHEVQLILMDNEQCKSFFPAPSPGSTRSYYIYDDMVCAADYDMTKSICAGDSGGPLVCLLDGSWYLVGLTSWSASCETPIASPSVFARVSYFDNWIKEHKKASPDPEPQGPYRPPPHQRPPSYGARPPPYRPRPPGDGTPWNSDKDQGTIICMALLSSQVLLLQLV